MITDFVAAQKYMDLLDEELKNQCSELGVSLNYVGYEYLKPEAADVGISLRVFVEGEPTGLVLRKITLYFQTEEDRNLFRLAGDRKESECLIFEIIGVYHTWDIALRNYINLKEHIKDNEKYYDIL